MIYRALGKDWTLAFPFSARRALEEKYGKGFYGICKMITPKAVAGMDLADLQSAPDAMLEMFGNIRIGVLVDMLQAGTEGLDEETAIKIFEELKLINMVSMILSEINGDQAAAREVEDDASRPSNMKKKIQTKKPNG